MAGLGLGPRTHLMSAAVWGLGHTSPGRWERANFCPRLSRPRLAIEATMNLSRAATTR